MHELRIKFKLGDEVYLAFNKREYNIDIWHWVYEGPYKVCEIRITEHGTRYYVRGAEWLHGYDTTPSFGGKNLFKTERSAKKAATRFHNEELKHQMK